MLLSRNARDLGSLLLCSCSFCCCPSLPAHELPAASIAAAVIAGVVAQDWYRRSFNMQYSTDSRGTDVFPWWSSGHGSGTCVDWFLRGRINMACHLGSVLIKRLRRQLIPSGAS